MRLLLGCLLIFILGEKLYAQENTSVFQINDFSKSGFVQLTGWKYHAGDDPAFKEPSYNDSNWETGKYEKIEMPEFISGHPRHIGWFRVKFYVPDSLKKHELALWIQCMGATETFLNGNLVHKSGIIDNDPEKVRPVNQTLDAIPVSLSNDSIQVLAMRFAYQTKIPYLKTPYQLTAITVMFGRIEKIMAYMHETLRPSYFLFFAFFVGLYFILFVLHSCFYLFYRRGIQNLFYASANLVNTIAWALMPVMLYTSDTISRSIIQVPFRLTYILAGLFFVLTIYEIFGYRKRKVLLGYFVFAATIFTMSFINENFLSLLFLMPNIYYLEAIRVGWMKRKEHKTAASVIITALLFNLLVSTLGVYFLSQGNYQLAMFFITCSGAIVSIATSVAIARQFADTNITLQQKLVEVEQLSAEKNKILTEQNVILEARVKQRTAELNESVEDLKATQLRLKTKNRELEIEGAVERVRAKAMAMQQSTEILEVVIKMKNELAGLELPGISAVTLMLSQDDGRIRFWDITATKENELYQLHDFIVNLEEEDPKLYLRELWQSKEKFFTVIQDEESYKITLRWLTKFDPDSAANAEKYIREYNIKKSWHPAVQLTNGKLNLDFLSPPPAETETILLKMAAGFDLAYQRFNDLKRAEAQAEQAKQDFKQIQAEKKRAEAALNELQSAQQQLIQAEKMASLGELTAGIAHEIQNPLNFVNNFSEVNKELIEEMLQLLAPDSYREGNWQEAKEIGSDIKANEEKINYHGKRADAIVKNMLLHSRTGTGKKESTDINALADEYLRLAFHGQRAKDNSFNAKLETDFDPALSKIDVVPQDMGRVLLNLINNAFFAVEERSKAAREKYEPTVKISSKKNGNRIEIKISDNGEGISEKIRDKIFQPFFTTKATGQGTGLGLSLSYDIIRAHGGEIAVKSKDGEGSEFTITLPIQ